jgi:hypothetical protein
MDKAWVLLVVGIMSSSGCTTVSLEHYTLTQNRTAGEARDRAVLNCLATVAANRNVLPSYSIYSNGVTTVTDAVSLGHTVTWAAGIATLESLALTASRTPKGQWTVDPAVEYERLEAFQAACWWVLFGDETGRIAYEQILGDPTVLLDNKPHFGVDWRLQRIQPGWLGIGHKADVPRCARYTGNCGNTWVWVMPDRTDAFAAFTLALQDIATLDPTIITAPPILVQVTVNEITRLPDLADKAKNATIATNEIRAVKPQYQSTMDGAIQRGLLTGKVDLTRRQLLEYTEPWFGQRTTSSIAAAAPSLAGRATPTQLPPGLSTIPGRTSPPPVLDFEPQYAIPAPPPYDFKR